MQPKYIRWRLRDLPSAEGLAALVAEGVITKEEARFILLGETEESKRLLDGEKKRYGALPKKEEA